MNPGFGTVIVVLHERAWFLREEEAFQGLVFIEENHAIIGAGRPRLEAGLRPAPCPAIGA